MSDPTTLGVAVAVVLGYTGWLGVSVVTLRQKVSKAEGELKMLQDWLKRIEEKLDSAIAQ